MRVLLSAYSCSPQLGSEPGIGWELAVHLSDRFDVTVITSPRNRDSIEAARGLLRRPVRFVYVEMGTEERSIEERSMAGDLFVLREYIRWQLKALRVAREMHLTSPFDLVHHVTFVSAWLPSFMGRLGIPFVWNAGTTATIPPAFLRFMSSTSTVYEAGRIARIRLALPATRRVTISPKTAVITSSPDARWSGAASVHGLLVGALTQEELARCSAVRARNSHPFRAACIGRLLGFKGFDLAIRGFAAAQRKALDLELWVIGTGPERSHLERLAAQLGCSRNVRFLGWLPRSEMLAALSEVDVMLAPSLREQNARYAIIEAMASGVPTICLGIGGPGLVTPEIGREVPLGDPESVVKGLADALFGYALDPVACGEAKDAARRHAAAYWSWDALTDRICAVYDAVLKA